MKNLGSPREETDDKNKAKAFQMGRKEDEILYTDIKPHFMEGYNMLLYHRQTRI